MDDCDNVYSFVIIYFNVCLSRGDPYIISEDTGVYLCHGAGKGIVTIQCLVTSKYLTIHRSRAYISRIPHLLANQTMAQRS